MFRGLESKKSHSILSRRLVDNGGSTCPVSGLSYFFKYALFLEICTSAIKLFLIERGISLGVALCGVTSCFVWRCSSPSNFLMLSSNTSG